MLRRLAAYEIRAEAEEDTLTATEDMRAELRPVPGVTAIRSVGLAEGRYLSIACHESRDAMEATAGKSRETFARLAPHIKLDSLEQRSGAVTWQL